MWRYIRLFSYFVSFSVSRALEFRFDFFFRVAMDAMYYFMNIAFYKILFHNTPWLGGWNEQQMLVFVASYCVVDALQMTLFSNNVWWLSTFVNRGDLDYYIVRPVSSLFFLSLRDFAVNSFINLLMALGILAWALTQVPTELSPLKVVLFVLLVFNGAFIHYLIHLSAILPVFWTHSGRGVEQGFWSLSRCMERPDRIFRGWVWRILTTLLPFSLMASFPSRIINDVFDPWVVVHIVVVTAILYACVTWIWNRGLKVYSSASS